MRFSGVVAPNDHVDRSNLVETRPSVLEAPMALKVYGRSIHWRKGQRRSIFPVTAAEINLVR
jgi:hypothetical protein